jgi:hypothetical protein
MPFSEIIKREFEVAFSRHAQPVWFRISKYVLLGITMYFFGRSKLFWIIIAGLFVMALVLHFWYRYKTEGWTKSYGMWDYEKNKPKEQDHKN